METKERLAKRQHDWYIANRDRLRETSKAYRDRHRDVAAARMKVYSQRPEVKAARRKYLAMWREKNRDKNCQQSLKDRRDKRERVFELLGNKCNRCSFEDPRALQVDHKKQIGGKTLERIRQRELAIPLYRAILRGEKVITNYQLLCANCNVIKQWEDNGWILRADNG